MARPLRIEFAGTLYHVTSRGDGREDVYAGANDREVWLEILGQVGERFNWTIHAYCQMGNHLVAVPAREDGLHRVFKPLHMRHAQSINRRHGWWGHLWQGRFFSSPFLG